MEDINMDTCTEKQYEKWFWKEYNEKCFDCKKTCKQSSKVQIMYCDKEK